MFNLATAWEAVSDAVPEADAAVCGDETRSWRDFERNAACVAGALAGAGLGPRDNVGLCLYNGIEYTEAQFGVMKSRCSPFNVNYRYGPAELESLLSDADARAVFYSSSLVDRFEAIHDRLRGVALFVQVGPSTDVPDWAVSYQDILHQCDPQPRIERDLDDLWILFTGGTTGNPKGVMWPHSSLVGTMEAFFEGMRMTPPSNIDELIEAVHEIRERGFVTRQLAAAPLMHGTAGLPGLATMTQGGAVLTLASESFDADLLWRCVERDRATHVTIVGDAFCRPMIDALQRAVDRGEPYDLSSVFMVTSSGVMWSAPVKAALLEFSPKMRLLDSLGSSEGAGFANKLEGHGEKTSTARFTLSANTRVLDEQGVDVVPGSGHKGRLALAGHLPVGYYKDPEKSAETWPLIGGQRYSIPGDWATVEADGSIVLLGRGSACINSGGEKIYPEEVEEALKTIADVVDANVVGTPDDRWGEAVTAVVELTPDSTISDDDIVAGVKVELAAYKAPKHIIRVPVLLRSPNGKSDYRWAASTARTALGLPAQA